MKAPPGTRLRNAKGLRPLRCKVNEIKAKGDDRPVLGEGAVHLKATL